MASRKKKIWISVSVIILIIAAFFALRSYIFTRIRITLIQKIEALNKTGFNITYDSIFVDWQKNSMMIENLLVEKSAPDTTCKKTEFISIKTVRANGFRVMSLLFKKELSFSSVTLTEPEALIQENSSFKADSVQKEQNQFTLKIDQVYLDKMHLSYTGSTDCKLVADVMANVQINSFVMDSHSNTPFVLDVASIETDTVNIDLPEDFYSLKIQKTSMNLDEGILAIDTIRITPMHGRYEFGKRVGYESDRIDGVVPFVKLRGFALNYPDSLVIRATHANLQFFIKIFRDKRLPFKKTLKKMPIAMLQDLSYGLNIDTLTVTKSFVQYEEFDDEAGAEGGIYFDNLSARVHHVNNMQFDGKTEMIAEASFMGQGDLKVRSLFPWGKAESGTVHGNLKNFRISKINSMLEPLARMKVESGDLENLEFNFAFNGIRSKGQIELNYKNLKLISYKDEEKVKARNEKRRKRNQKEENEIQKDNLKTLILNAFIIRKNMDENVPEDKRTGDVLYYRDTSRSVFNYWSKSLLSGIKSAYNIDKLEEKKSKREQRKARRQERRNQRKK